MNIDANDVINKYRQLVSELQYNLLVTQVQVEQLQKELTDVKKDKDQASE